MNTINISGWQACVCGFDRRAPLIFAFVLATTVLAHAQTGTFPLIDGPGLGNNVMAIGGVVVGPGLTSGNLAVPHPPGCIGPEYHFHGQLSGLPDPAPLGCGWGHVNYIALVPPLPVMSPTMIATPALPARKQTSASRKIAIVEPQPAFVPRTASEVLALKYSGGPEAGGQLVSTSVALRKTFTQLITLDARHAMKQTPRPLPRTGEHAPKRPRSNFWDFSLTGQNAKLSPYEPQKAQP